MALENNNEIEDQRRESSEASIDRVAQFNQQKREAAIIQEEENLERIRKEEKTFQDMQPNAVNKATSELLKGSWDALIESFGLTLIWIDIHIFLGLVLGNKLFCKLGMEWVPDALKQMQFKKAEKIGKTIGYVEGTGVACLNLGCLIILLAAAILIAIIYKILANPLDALWEMPKVIWNVLVSIVKG